MYQGINHFFYYFCKIKFALVVKRKRKKILKIVLLLPIILLVCLALLYAALRLPSVQQRIKDIVLTEITKKTHNRMEIKEISFRPFNQIQLTGIYVEDLNNDTLLYAESLSARFDLLKLRDNELIINSIRLDDWVAKVSKDSADADFNFQFLINAFTSEEPDTVPSAMQFQLSDIQLKNGRLHYDVFNEPLAENDFLDVNHIQINDLLLKAAVNNVREVWNIQLKQLSFVEQKGLQLDEICGVFDTKGRLNIKQLQAGYKDCISLKINASMEDYTQWQTSPLQINMEEIRMDTLTPVNIRLNGSLQGNLSDLLADIQTNSDCGDLYFKGRGAYNFTTETASFDASVHASNFDLKTLLNDSVLGAATFQLKTQGTIINSGKINLRAEALVERFDYQNYTYKNIDAQAVYHGEKIELQVNSHDENILLDLDLIANTAKKSPSIHLNVDMKGVCVEALHFLPDAHNLFLVGKMRADVQGFDFEKMKLHATFDHLTLTTDAGTFFQQAFHLNYQAQDSCRKDLRIDSDWLQADISGRFSYAGMFEALKSSFPMLFPTAKLYPKKRDKFPESLQLNVGVNRLNDLAEVFAIPQTIPDSVLLIGKYAHEGNNTQLSASAYTRFSESDTLQLSLALSNKAERMSLIFNLDNKSSNYDLDGSFDTEIMLLPVAGRTMPDMNIFLNPSVWVFNDCIFDLQPAQIDVENKRYTIRNFTLNDIDNPLAFIQLNGIISEEATDSVTLDIAQFPLSSIFNAMKTDFPLAGMIQGRITARNLTDKPLIFTRDLAIQQLKVDGHSMGELALRSAWSSEQKALALSANLRQDEDTLSTVRGYYRPETDSINFTAHIRDIELQWFKERMNGMVYGLGGNVGANVLISGTTEKPKISGTVMLNQAQAGIPMLNTLYTITDSIRFDQKSIELKNFKIYDEKQRTLTANGKITHTDFSDFKPDIKLILSDFMLLNNPNHIDSLLYGHLCLNGLLQLKSGAKEWLLSGDLVHSDQSIVTVNMRNVAGTATRYDHISYLQTDSVKKTIDLPKNEGFSLPLKLNVNCWLDPSLSVGVIFNPLTGDAARVKGNGSIRLLYDMPTSKMDLLGNYEVEKGTAGLTIANFARKTFNIQSGSKLLFNGDPMATTFDLTANNRLRADLTTLDPSFSTILANPSVPVDCSLSASGSINDMANSTIKYNILLPNESDEAQRHLDGLLYTNDMKIKEIAYLLALGSFLPLNENVSDIGASSLVNSLTAFSTGGLNQLLAGILNDKWTIGTDFHARDATFNAMDMDLNISGHLFNDRLIINSTVGYHNNTQLNNFTGDFSLEYKLNAAGNLMLRAYNQTNNRYYEQAPTTQGVGLVYKRQARTLKKLFRRLP